MIKGKLYHVITVLFKVKCKRSSNVNKMKEQGKKNWQN